MKASEFIAKLPEVPGPAREGAILEAIFGGDVATVEWAELVSEHNGHNATLFVTTDALRVGDDEDSLRVTVSPRSAQRIADKFGCMLLTPHICDLVWEQAAVRLTPSIQKPDALMGNTSRMVLHNKTIEGKLAGRKGLIENVGKHWVLTNRLTSKPGSAANYGWFDDAAPGQSGKHKLWQTLGLAHNLEHVDYSQVIRLVMRWCLVDGEARDLFDIVRDEKLAGLVSSEGPLTVCRLPGVPAQP